MCTSHVSRYHFFIGIFVPPADRWVCGDGDDAIWRQAINQPLAVNWPIHFVTGNKSAWWCASSWGSKPKHAEFLEVFKFNILCINSAGAQIF
jgi:hypothetical protein